MSDLIQSLENGILTLTINRPQAKNAITTRLIDEMKQAIGQAAENPEVRCLVLTGAGGVFCVGADANEIPTDKNAPVPSHEMRVRDLRAAADLSLLLHRIPKPTIAVISGPAAGGGFSLATACDMRFCLDTATLSTAFSMIGGSGDFGVSYFLPRLIGVAKARDLLFTSRRIKGQEAFEIGLVDAVASKETFEADAATFIREIANLPTIALGHIKENLFAALSDPVEKVLDKEAENMVLCMETDDHRNAVKSFLKKEKPTFQGR